MQEKYVKALAAKGVKTVSLRPVDKDTGVPVGEYSRDMLEKYGGSAP